LTKLKQGGEEIVEIQTFGIGMRCEALYQDKWYPAIIKALDENKYTVMYLGFGNIEIVAKNEIRPLVAQEGTLEPAILKPGFECSARYSGDGLYYDAKIDEETQYGYKLTFVEYGDQEEVPLEYIKIRSTTTSATTRKRTIENSFQTEIKRKADGTYDIPPYLRLNPNDSDAERQRKRRKVRALKLQAKQKEEEEIRAKQQNNWHNFQNRGAQRKVPGSLKSFRKESIFKAPDSVDGKVGVTGSGRGLTRFGDPKKFFSLVEKGPLDNFRE